MQDQFDRRGAVLSYSLRRVSRASEWVLIMMMIMMTMIIHSVAHSLIRTLARSIAQCSAVEHNVCRINTIAGALWAMTRYGGLCWRRRDCWLISSVVYADDSVFYLSPYMFDAGVVVWCWFFGALHLQHNFGSLTQLLDRRCPRLLRVEDDMFDASQGTPETVVDPVTLYVL